MISNQILQSTIDGLKEITQIDLHVFDIEGKVLASTYGNATEYSAKVSDFAKASADYKEVKGCHLYKIYDEGQLEYILYRNIISLFFAFYYIFFRIF